MVAVRMTGSASGLPPDIVEQIMAAERIPVQNLEARKSKEEEITKLIGDLEQKVGDINKNLMDLVGPKGFTDTKLVSSNPNIIDGVADPSEVQTGEHIVECIQLANRPGAITNAFPDKDITEVGVGYIRFKTPQGVREVYIDGKNSTLEKVAEQINASGTGITAHILDDRKDKEYPYKLLITGLAMGDDHDIDFPIIYMLDGDMDFYFEDVVPARNAKVKIDGFEIDTPENMVPGIIPGVTLELKDEMPGRKVRISVKENLEVINGKIKAFIDAYNAALTFIQTQNKLQKGQNGKESLGPLGGQSVLRTVENTLRKIIQEPQYGIKGSVKRVIDLGIEFNRNGTLTFSQEKFNKVINTSAHDVAAFLRGDGFTTGFAPTVKRLTGYLLNGEYGALSNRKKGIQEKINNLNKSIENKQRQLEGKEEQLRRKFGDLEAKVSGMQKQGQAIAASMNNNQKNQ